LTDKPKTISAGDALRLARPEHWIKNVLVLFPVVSALRVGDVGAWVHALVAAAAFCLVSSAGYILNDVVDRHADRLHPRKKDRPLAAGRVSPAAALIEAAVLLVVGLAMGLACRPMMAAVLGAYVLLQLGYSLWLKHKMLVDAICISLGFVLRAAGGAVAIGVEISPWLFICTFTLCLFLAFCKRRNEATTLGEAAQTGEHRPTLIGYTPELLTHLITLSAAIAVIAFLMYSLSGRTTDRIGIGLVYTLPIVIYAIFRFAMLSMFGRYADPTDMILHDRPFQLTILVWVACVVGIFSYGARPH